MTMLKVKPEFIKPLEIGVSHILTLPRDHSDTSSKTVTVTLIDANHIRGSVMFLFEGTHNFYDLLCKCNSFVIAGFKGILSQSCTQEISVGLLT